MWWKQMLAKKMPNSHNRGDYISEKRSKCAYGISISLGRLHWHCKRAINVSWHWYSNQVCLFFVKGYRINPDLQHNENLNIHDFDGHSQLEYGPFFNWFRRFFFLKSSFLFLFHSVFYCRFFLPFCIFQWIVSNRRLCSPSNRHL